MLRTRARAPFRLAAAAAPVGAAVTADDPVQDETVGKGDGTFDTRIRVGGGWNEFATTFGIGDADRDGRNGLVALDDSGMPYLYKGTGSRRAPFQGRTPAYSYARLPISTF
ncbi:hypothetical protein AB0424_11905 [Streptomyces sp. NPDC051180]|uniref:hypothetical protein n=1 Tax=Streptomyces sp. NPDC051180 TaxID=3155797 RepID=UPI00344EA295